MSDGYEGESRLALKVSVENGPRSQKNPLDPALGYMDGETLRFDRVKVRGEFPADFRVDVYSAPKGKQLTQLEPQLAPDDRVAIQFLGAVPKDRHDIVIDFAPKPAPEAEPCWDGSCDFLPGRSVNCDENPDDPDCASVRRKCVDEECEPEMSDLEAPGLPEDIESIVGFSSEHVVLYVRDALPEGSWAAVRLGAPDGLSAGYHLAELREPSEEALTESSRCEGRAREEALEAYNAERDTPLDVRTMRCFFGEESTCDLDAIPAGKDAKELAERVAQAEADARCSMLAVDMAPVDPAAETITIVIGESVPEWRAMRPSIATEVTTPEEL